MEIASEIILVICVVGAIASLTSIKGTLEIFYILLINWPIAVATNICRFFFPKWFMKDVSEDVVVITGGASGIGLLLAKRFAKLGAKVVLIDMNNELLEKALQSVQNVSIHKVQNAKDSLPKVDKRRIHAYVLDVTNRDGVYSTFEEIQKNVGKVTILINNAGIVSGKPLLDCPDDLLEKTMQVNTISHFWTVKSVLPSMLENNKGHIVTISSMTGLIGIPGMTDYCASKYAAIGFDESIRAEIRKLGKDGVNTTCFAPFLIDTGMFEGTRAKWPKMIPMLQPDWVADRITLAIRTNELFVVSPVAANLVFLGRGLFPFKIFDKLADWIGTNDFMQNFVGRKSIVCDPTSFRDEYPKIMEEATVDSGTRFVKRSFRRLGSLVKWKETTPSEARTIPETPKI